MADKKETQLSFLFEIPNLANGEKIKSVRKDMRQYAISRGFNLPPKINHNSPINYTDELATIIAGEEYLEDWDYGQILIADSERVRLYCTFRADGYDEFYKTERFQKVCDDTFDYIMSKGIYPKMVNEQPIKPPILFSIPHFSMSGPGDYITVNFNLRDDVLIYAAAQRKKYGEPGPQHPESHKNFLESLKK